MRPRSAPFIRRALPAAVLALVALLATPHGYASTRPEAGGVLPSAGLAPVAEPVKLIPSDPDSTFFGEAVALDGDTAAVSDARAVGEEPLVFVFERDAGGPGRWGEVAILGDPDGDDECCESFGSALAISGDWLAAGALGDTDLGTDAGAVYLFERNTGGQDNWGLVAKVTAADGGAGEVFGWSVALDGDTLVVGAPDTSRADDRGAVYVFERDAGGPGAWGQVAKIVGPRIRFGISVALDGDLLLVGEIADLFDFDAGAAYVHARDRGGPDNWGRLAKLENVFDPFGFGQQVALAGDTAVVSADPSGPTSAVYRFQQDPDDPRQWHLLTEMAEQETLDADGFGSSLRGDGDLIVIGAENDGVSRGSVSVFKRDSGGEGEWEQGAQLTAPDATPFDRLGGVVAVSARTVLAGAQFADPKGAAYVYELRSFGPYLKISGECPGTVRVEISAAGANRPIVLAGSFAEGSYILPGGSCAGTELGLDRPRLLRSLTTDERGNAAVDLELGAGPCGAYLQALATTSCLASDVDRLPQPKAVLRYDTGRPADYFEIPRVRGRWVGNVFDTAQGSPLAGGSLSAVGVYLRDRGRLGEAGRIGIFSYPTSPAARVSALEYLAVPIRGDETFHSYVLANPIAVPSRFLLGHLLNDYCFYEYCYPSGGSLGMGRDTVAGQGHHGFEADRFLYGSADQFRRLDANAMLRARGGFGPPLLPVELMNRAPE